MLMASCLCKGVTAIEVLQKDKKVYNAEEIQEIFRDWEEQNIYLFGRGVSESKAVPGP